MQQHCPFNLTQHQTRSNALCLGSERAYCQIDGSSIADGVNSLANDANDASLNMREGEAAGGDASFRRWPASAASGDPSQVRDALLTLPPTVDLNCRDSSGRTVVHVAADSGSVEALMVLEQRGADLHQLNTDCENGLHLASHVGNDEVAAFFLDRSVCPEGQNRADSATPGLSRGHLTILRLLLLGSRRASPNSRDRRHQRTPLVIAASEIVSESLGIEVARVLLRAGARPDIPDSEGWGPLRHAIQRQHQAMAMLLISAGAPLDQLDSSERDSPLHAASRLGQLPVVQALCAYGCRVDAVNVQGLTPLHQTARAGHLEVVRCLLLAGANPQLASQEGLLP
uniref:ANK_REP_REGION domain-containing protein n=1 Tax=Macrostomum lignano TaxID=282301 RepID=A0A1I8JR76_9PLAT